MVRIVRRQDVLDLSLHPKFTASMGCGLVDEKKESPLKQLGRGACQR